jgi:ketosteroid isomerase-like protein
MDENYQQCVLHFRPKDGVTCRELEVLDAIADAFHNNDNLKLSEHLSEQIEFDVHGPTWIAGAWQGKSEVISALYENYFKVTGQKTRLLSLIHSPCNVAMQIEEGGVQKSNGLPYSNRVYFWFHFVEEKLRHIEQVVVSLPVLPENY